MLLRGTLHVFWHHLYGHHCKMLRAKAYNIRRNQKMVEITTSKKGMLGFVTIQSEVGIGQSNALITVKR
jgi:hypothetical protein